MVTENDVLNSKGWIALNRISSLSNMHNVFFQNALCLNDLLEKICNNARTSQSIQQASFEHLQQYIFNYLASSSSLIDITRRFIKHYEGTRFYIDYENKVSVLFKNNNLSHFIKDLRNNQIHCDIPYPYLITSFLDDKKLDVVFSTNDLLKSKYTWKTKSKNFIKRHGERIYLTGIFTNYTNLINAFYMWLYNEVMKYHKEDFAERDFLIKESKMKIPHTSLVQYNLSMNNCGDALEALKILELIEALNKTSTFSQK